MANGTIQIRPHSRQRLVTTGTLAALCVLAALWLWCKGGGTTTIRVVSDKGLFRAYIDGRLIVERSDKDASTRGGIAIWYDRAPNWSMPIPQTLRSVKVTETGSGKVLLFQDFREPLLPVWVERTASCEPGPLGYQCDRARPVRLGTGYREWENYTLDLTVRNCSAMEVACRYNDPGNYVEFSARPFREVDSCMVVVTHGARQMVSGEKSYYRSRETLKNILLLFLHHLPVLVLALAALAVISRLLGFLVSHITMPCRARVIAFPAVLLLGGGIYLYRGALKNIPLLVCHHVRMSILALAALVVVCRLSGFLVSRITIPRRVREIAFLTVLFLGSGTYLAWINYSLLDHMPHVQDSCVYNFQGQLLSRGAFYAPAPPNQSSFAFEFLIVRNGKWFGQYPWGHPLLLAAGHLVGKPWIIPPLVGACVLVSIYFIAGTLFSPEVAVVSALLMLSSPFFQVMAPNFMSHSSGSFYLALGVLFLVRAPRTPRPSRQALYGFLSGLALGLFFNTRPLHAIPALALTGGMFLYFALTRRVRLRAVFAFSAGALLLLAFFLFGNYAVMGNPFDIPYRLVGNDASFFGARNPLGLALLHYYTSLTLFVMVAFGWPAVYTASFFLAFVLLAKKKAENVYLLLLLAGVTGANLFYTLMASPGHMYGPRFMYETLFVFVILTAAGWDAARRFVDAGIAACARSFPLRARVLSWLAHLLFLALLAYLVVGAERVWLSRGESLFDIGFMPGTIYGLKGFNYTSGEMRDKVMAMNIHHALLFVEDKAPDWWYYGALFPLNSPFLDSDIIVARDKDPGTNRKLIRAFPGRNVYLVNVQRREVTPYPGGVRPGAAPVEDELVADDEDPEFRIVSGKWGSGGNAGCYGTVNHWALRAEGFAEARWVIPIPESGGYEVCARWSRQENRATDTPYMIRHEGGVATVRVNQQEQGGKWVSLGVYRFSKDSPATITVTNDADQWVIADAVKLKRRPDTSPRGGGVRNP